MKFVKIIFAIVLLIALFFTINNNLNKNNKTINEIIYTDTEQYISNKTKNSIIIKWQSQEKEVGSIQYGIMKDIYYKSTTDIEATNIHEIKLDFLQKCTKYYYHISSASMIFDVENSSFTTLCDNGKITNKLNIEDKNE